MEAAEIHKSLGQVVRTERQAQKLTQAELGQYSGTGLNFVSQLERGKPTVRFDKLISILSVLGLELHLQRGKRGISLHEDLSV